MKNIKLIMEIIIALSIFSIGAYAIELCNARDIEFKANNLNWQVDTVEEALNDLYDFKLQPRIVYGSSVETIEKLALTGSTELTYDHTENNNLRYIGQNPNNYVEFNGEKWRILGVMNNVENNDGNKEPKLKIIRDSIGKYSWDNKPAGTGSSDSSYGSNDWTDATLMNTLNNGAYWNRVLGTCPTGENNTNSACDFSNSGLTNEAKNQIEKVTWKLGNDNTFTHDNLANSFYNYERYGSLTWKGYVALMYVSDYGFAVGGTKEQREKCLSTPVSSWSEEEVKECKNNNWLFNAEEHQWTLTPLPNKHTGFRIINTGDTGVYFMSNANAVRPTVYLKNNIKFISGDGSFDNPFRIEK